MKKKISLVVMAITCLFLTGCHNVDLDLNKISEKLDSLTTGNFDLLTAVGNIEMDYSYFEDLVTIYDFDLKELGINKDNILDMAFRVDSDGNPAYIIIKPMKGKAQNVKTEIESYLKGFTNLNERLETEYEGHLIYLFSDQNEELLEKIKNSESRVFGMLMNVDKENIEDLLGINPNSLDEFLVKNSVMAQSSGYYILKPVAGKEEMVEDAMEQYMDNLEAQWSTYLPDQYELVENRLEEEYGDYLIYIISNNNELVFRTIKNCRK